MARPRKTKRQAVEASEQTSDIVAALEWIKVAQKDVGPANETHCYMGFGAIVAFDGVVAAGHKANVQDVSAPHTFRLLSALSRTKGAVQLVHTQSGDISISAGSFKARVPTIPPDTLLNIQPDPRVAYLTDAFRDALALVEGLSKESAQTLHASSILIRANTVVGTDGITVLEAWHGIDLPTLVIPKTAAAVIAKTSKPLTGFGFGPTSATFWFGDDCWYRTQLYVEKWPNIDVAMARNSGNWFALAPEFFDALDAVAPFTEDGFVHYYDGRLCSHSQSPDVGASYAIALPGVPEFSANGKRLSAFRWATWVAFDEMVQTAYFEGKGFAGRGGMALAHLRAPRIAQGTPEPAPFTPPASTLPEPPASPPWGAPVPAINPFPRDPGPFNAITGEKLSGPEAAAHAFSVELDNDIPF